MEATEVLVMIGHYYTIYMQSGELSKDVVTWMNTCRISDSVLSIIPLLKEKEKRCGKFEYKES